MNQCRGRDVVWEEFTLGMVHLLQTTSVALLHQPSALFQFDFRFGRLDFRVDALQFATSVVKSHLPVNRPLLDADVFGPGRCLTLERFRIA